MRKNKKIISAVLAVTILTAAVGIGVFLTQKAQKTEVGATGVALTLTANSATPKVNDTFVVAVSMDTQGVGVTGADLKLKYNSNLLTATSITIGGFLPTVFIAGSVATPGSVGVVLGCLIDSAGSHSVNGTGLLAQVTFKAKAVGVSSVTFDPTTIVAVSGQTTNGVGTLTPVQITVIVPSTPTPVPTKSPTPVPTCQPRPACLDATPPCMIAEPVNGWCATPTPTPTKSPSPTPTPVKTPSPTVATIPGDINGDGHVTIVDVGILVDNYAMNPIPDPRADINSDGIVSIVDVGILIDNYGK